MFFLTFFAFPMMAYESPVTEPGAGNPADMYTTTSGAPNSAPGGPNRTIVNPNDPGFQEPIGAPWILLGFAAAYAGVRLVRKKE